MLENSFRTDELGDSVPIGLSRTVSDFSRTWLGGWEVVHQRKIPTAASKLSHSVLGGHLAATLAHRRRVIFDNIADLKLGSPDERRLRAIIDDVLGAHEIGGLNYLGHLSLYCHPQHAFAENLMLQDDIYRLTYVLQAHSSSDCLVYLGLGIARIIEGAWIAEMFSEVAEKRRLREHMAIAWQNPIFESFLADLSMRVDSQRLSALPHSVGHLALEQLKSLGYDVQSLVNKLQKFAIASAIPRRQETGEVWIGNREHHIIHEDLSKPAVLTLKGIVSRLFDGDRTVAEFLPTSEQRIISKAECLSENALQIGSALDAESIFGEFPESRAMMIGPLWLALHSAVNIEWLNDGGGLHQTLLEGNAAAICTAEVKMMATELLTLRDEVLDSLTLRYHSRPNYMQLVYEFMLAQNNSTKLEKLESDLYELHLDSGRVNELQGRFSRTHEMLLRYYRNNNAEIERYLKHPQDFFSKVVG